MAETFTPEIRPRSTESLARRFDAFCESHLRLILLAGSVIYILAMLVQSSLKPLWYDEVFTHLLATLPVSRLWEALKAGAEVHPPLSILLAHFAQKLFGETALATRLPSIAAFLGLALCVFFIVRRELNAAWGFAAAFLLFLTRAEFYATEARPYAILMFCAAFSLLCWQRMIAGEHRWWCLAGIALSGAAAVSAHFFGLLIAFPIALGELYRTWQRRQVDLPFWAALCAGTATIFAYLPIMRNTHRYVAHNLNPSHVRSLPFLYLGPLDSLIVIVPLVLAALWLQFGLAKHETRFAMRSIEVAACGLLLLPCFQAILGRFTNSMNPRYTESVVIGAALMFALGAARIVGHREASGFVCFALLGVATVTTGIAEYRLIKSVPHAPPILDVQGLPDLPIVIDQALLYMPIAYYNPRLDSRVFFVASPEDSIRTINSDTLDLNLLSQAGWLPLNVVGLDRFFHKGAHFLIYSAVTPQAWLATWELEKVNQMGGQARELRKEGGNYYFEVTIPN